MANTLGYSSTQLQIIRYPSNTSNASFHLILCQFSERTHMPLQWGYLNNKRIKFYRHNKSWIFMSCRARYSQCCYDYSRCKIMIAPRVWNVHAIDAKIPCTFQREYVYVCALRPMRISLSRGPPNVLSSHWYYLPETNNAYHSVGNWDKSSVYTRYGRGLGTLSSALV